MNVPVVLISVPAMDSLTAQLSAPILMAGISATAQLDILLMLMDTLVSVGMFRDIHELDKCFRSRS